MSGGRETLRIQTPDGIKEVTILADGSLVEDIGKTAYAGGSMPGWEGFCLQGIQGKGSGNRPQVTPESSEQTHTPGHDTFNS